MTDEVSNDSERTESDGNPFLDAPHTRGPILDSLLILRNRVIAGFFVALPFIITFILIRWLYNFIARDIIATLATWISPTLERSSALPPWLEYFVAPALAVAIILAVLFLLGMFFRSRTHRFFDWLLKKLPFVGTIYSAVANAVDSISKSKTESEKYKRVVLIKFPHAGTKVPAFVTSSCRDALTGKTILCVYVPTTPIPTSGYMLLVPEDEVTEISWDMSETLQAIVSGGITVPEQVEFFDTKLEINQSADNEAATDLEAFEQTDRHEDRHGDDAN